MGSFQKQVAQFAQMVEEQALAVVRTAIQEMTYNMQIPRAKGGRMPVDTGFLRWSAAGAINSVPVGSVKGRARMDTDPKEGPLLEYSQSKADFLQNTLAKMKIGDIFYWGWTAEYAYAQEMRCGFMESETAKWQIYIDDAVRRLNHG